jgi:hypothetical protein
MMLGQPVAMITPLLRVPGQIQRVAEGIGRRAPADNGAEIENGEGNGTGFHGSLAIEL